jgi:hypothetical protein
MNHNGLPRPENVRGETSRGSRFWLKALAVVLEENVMNKIGVRFIHVESDHVRLEYLADLVADQVVDGLHLQLRRQAFLHAVDDRQLGRTLLAFLEQPLRFVEEAGVLERGAE